MRIIVTGGTGFVGRKLVNRLLAKDHSVTVIARREPAEDIFDADVTFLAGSVHDPISLEGAFQGADVVYHLVGIIAETKTDTFEKTVAQGTRNVVDACLRTKVTKLLYLSAMGTSIEAPTAYHRTKFAAEQAVTASGIDFVIFRPSVIFGPGDGFVSLLTRLIKMSPVTPVIGDGKYKLQPVYIDDVVLAMVQSLATPEAIGKIIELGGPEKLEYLEILNIIKRVLGKSRVNFHIPIWVMKPIAVCLEKIIKPAPITRDQLAMMKMGNTGDIELMMKLFVIDPVSFEDGLRKYLRYENGGNKRL